MPGEEGRDPLEPPANCQEGIDGLEGMKGVDMPADELGPRLSRRALRDLSSCCSSARDCV